MTGHILTIEPLGVEIEVAEGQTLLDASLRAGIYLPHACGHGLCATCKVEVLDGEVDHGPVSSFALMDYERDEGRCLACCATPLSDVVIEADIDDEPDARIIPVRDAELVVERIEELTPTIRGIHLTVAGGGTVEHQAGQYLNLWVPGVEEPRAFSIANPPEGPAGSTGIELHVRLVPGGAATTWIHDRMVVGDRLRATAPYGRFFVRTSRTTPSLFLAGGSGLSSPRAMILDLLASGRTEPITLIHGARTLDELYHFEEWTALAATHDHLDYVPALSETAPEGWSGFTGFVHEAARERFDNDFRGRSAYLCGPPPMIEACLATLMQGRLFERDIFTERFLSAADAHQARSPLFRSV